MKGKWKNEENEEIWWKYRKMKEHVENKEISRNLRKNWKMKKRNNAKSLKMSKVLSSHAVTFFSTKNPLRFPWFCIRNAFFSEKINNQFWEVVHLKKEMTIYIGRETKTHIYRRESTKHKFAKVQQQQQQQHATTTTTTTTSHVFIVMEKWERVEWVRGIWDERKERKRELWRERWDEKTRRERKRKRGREKEKDANL